MVGDYVSMEQSQSLYRLVFTIALLPQWMVIESDPIYSLSACKFDKVFVAIRVLHRECEIDINIIAQV